MNLPMRCLAKFLSESQGSLSEPVQPGAAAPGIISHPVWLFSPGTGVILAAGGDKIYHINTTP